MKVLNKGRLEKNRFEVTKLNLNKNEVSIFIFYDTSIQIKNDCNKSKILPAEKCDFQSFFKKITKLNESVFTDIPTTLNIYKIGAISPYVKFENGSEIKINEFTAFYFGKKINSKVEITEYNKFSNSVDNSIIPNKIFLFSDSLSNINKIISLDKNWFALDIAANYKGNSCPALDIPKEDLFLQYLFIPFKSDVVLKRIINNNSNLSEKVDSLLVKVSELAQKLDSNKVDIKINEKKNWIIDLNIGYFQTLKTLENSEIIDAIYSLDKLDYHIGINKLINSKLNLGINYNFSTNKMDLKFDSLRYHTNLVIPNSAIIGTKNISINEYKEQLSYKNHAIGLNLGYILPINNERLSLQFGFQSSYIFPFVIFSHFKSGNFSYRGTINNIEDELINVESLDLKENVSFVNNTNQSLTFYGYNFNIYSRLNYSNNIFKTYINFGYNYNVLLNKDFKVDALISENSNSYQSSLYSIKSLTNHSIFFGFGFGLFIR